MRKIIMAILAATAILLGVSGSAQAEELDANGHMLEFIPCMAAAAIRPVVPMLGPDQDGGYWPAYSIPINWRQLAEAPCWRLYG